MSLLAVAGLVLALGGCGADEETEGTPADTGSPTAPTTTSHAQPSTPQAPDGADVEAQLPPEAQVDLAIKGVLASAAPDLACRRYATRGYVETTFGSRAGCVNSTVPASAAESVKVTKVEISGDEATAKAVPSGGPSDGETIKVELVRQGGIWKVDSLRSNAPVGP
jgi:hypothetical protein